MTYADTAKFSQTAVEVETDTPGTYAIICGITTRGVDRTSNMNSNEVPDCDDEDLPNEVQKDVQSQEVTISGSGLWSSQSHGTMMDWWYSGQSKNVRIHHVKAAVGDTEYETGPAYLTKLSNAVTKGQRTTADVSIEFDGIPTRTAAS